MRREREPTEGVWGSGSKMSTAQGQFQDVQVVFQRAELVDVFHRLARGAQDSANQRRRSAKSQAATVGADSPDAIHTAAVRVGDAMHCGIGEGAGEHAAVQRLLGQRAVGWVVLTRHQVHLQATLRRERESVKRLSTTPLLPTPLTAS